MVVLEKIMEMKKQGMPASQIIQTLKEQGISPKEINEAFSQSEIKSEISKDPTLNSIQNQQNSPDLNTPTQSQQNTSDSKVQDIQSNQPQSFNQSYPSQEMMPSMSVVESPDSSSNAPQNDSGFEEPPQPNQEPPASNQKYSDYPLQEQPIEYADSYYPEYEQSYQQYEPPQAMDIETINDISAQIVDEKTEKLKQEISQFSKFRKQSNLKLKEIDKRLEKIENIIEELQISIIKKIGGYGEDIKNISKEMKASRNSFSKILDPLTDNIRELQYITGKEVTSTKSKQETPQKEIQPSLKKRKNQEPSFEDYLR